MLKPIRIQSVVMMSEGIAHVGDESHGTGPRAKGAESVLTTP